MRLKFIFKKTVFALVILFALQACFFVVRKDQNTKSRLKAPDFSTIEQQIFEFQNLARTQPKKVAAMIKKMFDYYRGNTLSFPGGPNIRTREGISAAKEAYRYLMRVKPVPALKASKGMSLAAREHVLREGPKGRLGHYGSDGSSPFDRMNRHGRWLRTAGENLAYGQRNARHIIISLIIDDGVSSRGHRTNIFKKDFQVTGISFGDHRRYGTMCAIAYAGGYIDR